jgi:hypothetical protein
LEAENCLDATFSELSSPWIEMFLVWFKAAALLVFERQLFLEFSMFALKCEATVDKS